MRIRIWLQINTLLCFLGFLTAIPLALGAGDLTSQKPVELTIQLGDEKNALSFFPGRLELETGNLYKLVLHNKSPQKHYFSSDSFSRAVFTRKVQVRDKEGTSIAEVKGAIREIEVYPGQKAEWWLLPVKSGTFNDLKCTIKGHAEHGMVGSIVVR